MATNDLALIERAREALAQARTLEDVKEIRDKAAAVAHYAARRAGAEEAERYANEIRLRAERRLGEITREIERAAAGRPAKEMRAAEAPITKAAALEAVGIAKEDASRFERIAAIPEKRFESEVAKPEATTRGLARVGAEYRPQRRAKPESVRVAAPGVPESALRKRANLFRSDLERLLKRYVAKWPAGATVAPLADVLIETAKSLGEE